MCPGLSAAGIICSQHMDVGLGEAEGREGEGRKTFDADGPPQAEN